MVFGDEWVEEEDFGNCLAFVVDVGKGFVGVGGRFDDFFGGFVVGDLEFLEEGFERAFGLVEWLFGFAFLVEEGGDVGLFERHEVADFLVSAADFVEGGFGEVFGIFAGVFEEVWHEGCAHVGLVGGEEVLEFDVVFVFD